MLDRDTEIGALTYGNLDHDARGIAATLIDSGARGARVLLLYPPGLDFIRAFFGCLYANAVAVPCLPPVSKRQVERLTAVARDAGAAFRMSCGSTSKLVDGSKLENLRLINALSQAVNSAAAETWRHAAPDPADVAFLQYTSGSTRDPRGVMVSHANLMANSCAIRDAFGVDAESVIVSWLPPYHDMGLIGGIIQPIFAGAECILMAPSAFLQRPFRWLKAISDYKADISGGPNFAYDVCADRISEAEKATLDLNCWRAAFTGSEPVLADTLDRFAVAFSSCGFKRTAFLPCYGLAESTLMVTGAALGQRPKEITVDAESLEIGRVAAAQSETRRTRQLVSCGQAVKNHTIAIVDPNVPKVADDARIGEVWVAGPSVATGYWSRPEESAERFGAQLPGHPARPFLRTGDLGCVIEGELYITGRSQDLIILRGRNHYAEDIAETVRSSHPLLRSGQGTAFQVRRGERDHLAVVHETTTASSQNAYSEALRAIVAAVGARHAVMPSLVQLVRRGSVPRTTSGKVRRAACKDAALAGRLPVLALLDKTEGGAEHINELASPAETAKSALEYVCALAARNLGITEGDLDTNSPLVALGIDSLAAAEIASAVANAFGVEVSVSSILNGWTVADIARCVEQSEARPANWTRSAVPPPELAPATVDQHRLWMQNRISGNASALNLQTLYMAEGRLDPALLAGAFHAVVNRHATLRTGFESGDRLLQRITTVEPPISIVDCTQLIGSNNDNRIACVAVTERRRSFDLTTPPLIRLTLLRLPSTDALILTVHHIAADAASLNVIAKDLESAYNAGPKTFETARAPQYIEHATSQAERMNDAKQAAALRSWADLMHGVQRLFGADVRSETESYEAFTLADERLKQFARRYNVTPFTVALAIVQLTLHVVTGRTRFAIAVPFHNRRSTDLLNAVGPFAQPRFVVADIEPESTLEELLARVKAGILHAYEHGDVSITEVAAAVTAASDVPTRIEVLFTMLPPMLEALQFRAIRVIAVENALGTQDCELLIALRTTLSGLRVGVTSRLVPRQAKTVGSVLRFLLERLPDGAAVRLKDLTKELMGFEPRAAVPIVVAATFATEPLRGVFEFWNNLLNMQASLDFASYAQLGQQLLNPDGSLSRNRSGFNVMMLRATDLDWSQTSNRAMTLSASEFAHAVLTLAHRSQSHQLVCLCPAEQDSSSDGVEHMLREAWRGEPNISFLSSADILRWYPVDRIYDEYGARAAGLPYTEEYFAALGTAVIRRICAIQQRFLRKAIVVDCDNTLWEGVVAEDTPAGVLVSERCRKLQHWLSDRKAEGFLLCLCSKNNEADIRDLFESAPGMVIRWADFAASRIDWNDKSSNLRELAAELSIDLDSFVLLDDNPIECAEVEANCPGTLCIHVPTDIPDPEAVLRVVWAFDSIPTSAEATRRTQMYREQAERTRELQQAPSLAEFLQRLETRIDVFEPSRGDLRRLAELTARTTQFNTSPGRRSESEIASWLEDPKYVVRAIRVEDRFGQLGIVGCAVFRNAGSALYAEVFLLSCRALGRGVEHFMLAEIGRTAEKLGCSDLVIGCRRTQRNEPVRRFLESIAGSPDAFAGGEMRVSAHAASELKYAPPRSTAPSGSQPGLHSTEPAMAPLTRDILRQIASMYGSASAIAAALRPDSRATEAVRSITPPRTSTEARIAQIIAELLGLERVGRDEDFFALGGHSLLGARLLSRVTEEFNVSIPFEKLFTTEPTAAAFADLVDAGVIAGYEASAIESAIDPITSLSDAEIERLLAEDVDAIATQQNT